MAAAVFMQPSGIFLQEGLHCSTVIQMHYPGVCTSTPLTAHVWHRAHPHADNPRLLTSTHTLHDVIRCCCCCCCCFVPCLAADSIEFEQLAKAFAKKSQVGYLACGHTAAAAAAARCCTMHPALHCAALHCAALLASARRTAYACFTDMAASWHSRQLLLVQSMYWVRWCNFRTSCESLMSVAVDFEPLGCTLASVTALDSSDCSKGFLKVQLYLRIQVVQGVRLKICHIFTV
jgi:hypothetical protein